MDVTENAIRKLVGPSTGTMLAIPVTGRMLPHSTLLLEIDQSNC
jgi:hypothetical protein